MSASSSSSSSPLPLPSDLSRRVRADLEVRMEEIDRLLTAGRASEQEARDRALRALDVGTQTEHDVGTQTETGTNCGENECTAPFSQEGNNFPSLS